MTEAYGSGSRIGTTSIKPNRWGTVPGDDKLADATVSALCACCLVEFGGKSRGFDEALLMGKSER